MGDCASFVRAGDAPIGEKGDPILQAAGGQLPEEALQQPHPRVALGARIAHYYDVARRQIAAFKGAAGVLFPGEDTRRTTVSMHGGRYCGGLDQAAFGGQ